MQVFIPGLGWVLVCWLVQGRGGRGGGETYVDRAGLAFECVPVVELFLFNEDLFGVWVPDFP